MNRLIWIVGVLAIVALLLGGTIQAVSFLLWIAPVLLVTAVLLFILARSGGRRIPR
ncbi:putative membrane protein [Arthrobacter sp. V4I6]|uniref:hypothetical protein n=1 Tax=unclassified Arthrobacter TaxID=235627 RepID=UPI002780E4A2|nr:MULTISPECIES: hypothetical protein [unclassified Arthrobacter]MDQ0820846.1 putative membrane protein [Arthrobacter sp. V1I7]MDQ0855107.1 putative membrane protein [Arthrobacter sp. V4I6]